MDSKTLLATKTSQLFAGALTKGISAWFIIGFSGCTIRVLLSGGEVNSLVAYIFDGVLALAIVTTIDFSFNISKKRKLVDEKEWEEEQKRQEIEREERRFDRIVNCPYCRGTGEAVLKEILSGDDLETRWLDILDRQEYINNKEYYKNLANEAVNNSSRIFYRDIQCPYCKGKGISFAWIEKVGAHSDKCGTCDGKGKVKKKIKLDVGVEEAQVNCEKCYGSGKINTPEKEIVHLKTLGDYGSNEAGRYIEIAKPSIKNLVIGEKDFDLGIVERSRFEKSKPRFKE